MSTWLQFSFWDDASKSWTCALGSVSRISLPRRACLEAICFGGHWGLSRQLEQKFFLEALAICACERQSEQFEQGKTCCHMNYTIIFTQEPKTALLANRQHSFLQFFAWCSDWANTSGSGAVWNHVHLTSVVFEMVPATPEHASWTQCPEWISLPRRACLEAICFGGHWGVSRQLEQKFFLEACAIKSPFLPVRAKDSPNNSNKERLVAIWTIQ